VSARFLTENRDEAIALLRDTLHAPRFDVDAIERVRAQVISGLQSDAKDPDDIASATFSRVTWGAHPYGSEGKGTVESVAALTREDILTAHRDVFARDRLYVSAVGDITAAELSILLDDLLGDLPAEGKPVPGKAEVLLNGGKTIVEFETPQSVAVFGHAGIERDHPDFFPAFIMNHILGAGGFESRLMTEVREKRGLTYGIYSYLAPKDLGAIYVGRVSSSNDRMAETVEVVKEEWRRMAESGVSAEELAAAKTFLTGAYPLRFDGNARIAGIMVSMQMQDLPIDYIATRNDQVNAVTLEDLNRVASELLDPDGLHFVIVGQPDGIETSGSN